MGGVLEGNQCWKMNVGSSWNNHGNHGITSRNVAYEHWYDHTGYSHESSAWQISVDADNHPDVSE